MNDLTNSLAVVPCLVGTVGTIGGTALGSPVYTRGFQGALAIAILGGVQGSSGSTLSVAIKFQESLDPLGIGTAWTDITNEAISQGSFNLDTMTIGDSIAGGTTTGTWIPYESVKKYCKLADANRKPWIRPHATVTGTVGLGPKLAVSLLLEKPIDTYYVQSAVVQASGNTELTKLL